MYQYPDNRLQYVLLDQSLLKQHHNWSVALQELLEEIKQKKIQVCDIGGKDSPVLWSPSNSLVIADHKETVSFAKKYNMAVVGYEKNTRLGIHVPIVVEDFDEIDFCFLERVYQRHHHIPWTVLSTERCILRELTLEDLDELYKLYEPKEITQYMKGLHGNRTEEEEYTRAYIEHMYRFFGYGIWIVIDKENGKLMGHAGISHLEEEDQIQPELGYVIAKEYQKKGYGTEVCTAILDYAEEELGMERIYCQIQKENLSSRCLAKKLGFTYKKEMICDGKQMQRYLKILHF